jgi:hypothetical protein
MNSDDRDRLRCICEGIRRGVPRVVPEPLPSRVEELLLLLRSQEQSAEGARQASKDHAQAPR